MPANFKTYESQARLLAAVVAAHPELKLNYRAIAQHYGSEVTVSAIEHRFRPIKEQMRVLRDAVSRKVDTKNIDILDKDEIAKYFGESTADGIQFQFRTIKKEAEGLTNAVNKGENPVAAFGAAGGKEPKTPGKPRAAKPRSTPATGRSAATASGGVPSTRGKRKTAAKPRYADETDKDESPVENYDELDEAPITKRAKTTPSKMDVSRKLFTAPQPAQAPSAAPSAPATVQAPVAASQPNTQEATPSESDRSVVSTPDVSFQHATAIPAYHYATAPAPARTAMAAPAAQPPPSIFGNGRSATLPPQQSFTSTSTQGQQDLYAPQQMLSGGYEPQDQDQDPDHDSFIASFTQDASQPHSGWNMSYNLQAQYDEGEI